MKITERIQSLIADEHQSLKQALKNAEAAVLAIEARNEAGPGDDGDDASHDDIWSGRSSRGNSVFESRYIDTRHLREVWNPFSMRLRGRMDRIEAELLPLVERKESGDDDHDDALRAFAEELSQQRGSLGGLASKIKGHVMFLEELKRPMRDMFSAVEACDVCEEGEIIPALLSGSIETTDAGLRFRTSDDIARSLRTNIPNRPRRPPPKEPDPGLISRIFRSFLRK